MATIIPPTISRNVQRSEQETFRLLAAAPKDWVVIHSVKVPQRGSNRPREIDFVVLIGQVVICLEVKGGHFEVRNGQWYTRDGIEIDDPVEQARSAMFALRNHAEDSSIIEERFSRDVRFEYAVLFADGEWPQDVRRPPGCLLIDYGTFRDDEKFFSVLAKYARGSLRKRTKNQLRHTVYKALLDAQIDKLREFLSPEDFKLGYVRVDRSTLGKIDEELLKLTEGQYNALRISQYNDRVMVDGPAGTGKTVLAMELARRRHAAGQRVALICHSPNMQTWLSRQSLPQDIEVILSCPWVWPETLIEILFHHDSLRRNRYMLKCRSVDHPSIATVEGLVDEIVNEYRITGGIPLFDYLVVDEAQFMSSQCDLKLMDALLKGGISGGCWTVFGDFANQNIAAGSDDMDFRQQLERLNDHVRNYPTNYKLYVNCRNARPIAESTARFAIGDPYEYHPDFQVPGPDVRTVYYQDNAEVGDVLDSEISKLRGQNIRPVQIVVIGLVPIETFVARGYLDSEREYGGLKLNDLTLDYSSLSRSMLNFSLVIGFQGLESDVVIILCEETREISEYIRRKLYIAMSRARGYLIVIAHEKDKSILGSTTPLTTTNLDKQ